MAKVYPRGSEWRKWDLHVHSTASDGSASPQEIIEEAVLKGISVIALTDHHTAKNTDEIKRLGLDNDIKVISGIEFRTEYGSSCVHMIGLFPDVYNETDLNAKALHDLILSPLGLSDTAIISKGRENDVALSDDVAFKKGMFLVQVDFKKASNLIHQYGGLISVHAGSKTNSVEEMKHDGGSPRNVEHLYDSLGPVKDELMREYIDICEIRKENDSEIFYRDKFGLPSIIASDAHDKASVGTKYTWIKADPTFEGLKQIMFEPQDRVRLADGKPEEKTGYHVIDAVILKGNNFHKDYELYLNPNLNTIIGGRSTGKSTLLKCIAREINPALYSDDTFINDSANSLSLRWQDQETSLPRDIEYFEQSYMYSIAKESKKLDVLIENIIKNKDEGKLLSTFRAFRDNNKSEIIQKVNALFRIQQQLDSLMQLIREKGESKGVTLEIQALEKRITEIKSHTTLNSEELQKFEADTQTNIRHKESVNIIDKDVESLTLLSQKELLNRSFIYEFSSLSDGVSSAVRTIYDTITGETKKEWAKQINERIEALNKEKESLLSQSKAIEESPLYKKGVEDINNNIVYKEHQGKLDAERQKLTDIGATEKKLRATSDQVQELKKEIIALHCLYNTKTDELIAGLVISHEGLEIKSRKHYKKSELSSFLEGRLNQRGYARQENVANIVEKYPSDIEKVTGDFVDKNLMGQVEYKSGNVSENVVSELLSTNWFDISFELTYQDDVFTDMSQGKQAFVVLKLLLEFSDKKCPILIDQPEDSLDNRAIYSELVEYLKSKKKERQIILVTHNSNVVVSADAEQIIVANQHGKDSLNKDGVKFQYSCGSLENTYPKRELTPHIVLDSQGIREHVCEILEGGHLAFRKREEKYGFRQT